ncbi:hypothetical protein ARMGADRAFT_1089801 [Armillaria gallica]|uniref:DUF6532 domain-containing protein n=1 Tax=Armillaria gallica TaxID=47427 RepID=A0A2H3CX54_ARMGA|nr:hypothetical protein ARMGADRAFT_1089801 [Armillaria gallica]
MSSAKNARKPTKTAAPPQGRKIPAPPMCPVTQENRAISAKQKLLDTNAKETEIAKLKRLLAQKEKALQKKGALLNKTNEHLETLEQELDDDYASKHNGWSRPVLESKDEDGESNMIFASVIRTKGVVPIDALKTLCQQGAPCPPPTPQSLSRPTSPIPMPDLLTTPTNELVDYLFNSNKDEPDPGISLRAILTPQSPNPANTLTVPTAVLHLQTLSDNDFHHQHSSRTPKARTSKITKGNVMPCSMKPFSDGAKSHKMAEQVWAKICEEYEDSYELMVPMAAMMQKPFGLTSADKKSTIIKNKNKYVLHTTDAAFHYKDLSMLSCAYEHKIIFSSICTAWFKNTKDFRVKYSDYFDPILNVSLALVLTAIEFCLEEWSTGSYIQGTLNESEDKGHYMNFLKDVKDWTSANMKVTTNICKKKNTGAANRVVAAGHMNEDAITHAKKDMENRTGETDSEDEDEDEGEEGAPEEPVANSESGAGIGGSQTVSELG